ncbi:sigma 54-interacting transcriptional regulator, partial [Limimaricola sp. G21655-S1]
SNQIVNSLRRSLEVAQLKRENQALRRALAQSDPGSRRTDLIGSSAAISDVRAVLERVAQLKTPVLITGASGTGKEVAARHLH